MQIYIDTKNKIIEVEGPFPFKDLDRITERLREFVGKDWADYTIEISEFEDDENEPVQQVNNPWCLNTCFPCCPCDYTNKTKPYDPYPIINWGVNNTHGDGIEYTTKTVENEC